MEMGENGVGKAENKGFRFDIKRTTKRGCVLTFAYGAGGSF